MSLLSESILSNLVKEAKIGLESVTSFLVSKSPSGYFRLYSELDHASRMVRNIGLLVDWMCPLSIKLSDTLNKDADSLYSMQLLKDIELINSQLELYFDSVYMYGTILLDQLACVTFMIFGEISKYKKFCIYSA